MGYTWAMDEFECTDTKDTVCGVRLSDNKKNMTMPTQEEMSNFKYSKTWGGSSVGGSNKLQSLLPASSCGYVGPGRKTYPQIIDTKTYWSNQNDTGCRDKTVSGQVTNPSPIRQGGVITITIDDLDIWG